MREPDSSAHAETGLQEAVKCKVKWFNTAKGFGFVEPLDDRGDAFVHISILQAINLQGLPEGAAVVCDLYEGERGLQVARILDLGPAPVLDESNMDGPIIEGFVKFFNVQKGFGFVSPDDGSADVFIHMKVVEKSGLGALSMGQRVRLSVSNSGKGPAADGVEIVPV